MRIWRRTRLAKKPLTSTSSACGGPAVWLEGKSTGSQMRLRARLRGAFCIPRLPRPSRPHESFCNGESRTMPPQRRLSKRQREPVGGSRLSRCSRICGRNIGRATSVVEVSPCTRAKVAAASAVRRSRKTVRAAANRDWIPANAITFENTPKHLIVLMFFIIWSVSPITEEANQVPQRGGREKEHWPLIHRTSYRLRDRQIRPGPRNRDHAAGAKPHQRPGYPLTPEDPERSTRLAAVVTLFRNDRQAAPAKCNIRCCLSLA